MRQKRAEGLTSVQTFVASSARRKRARPAVSAVDVPVWCACHPEGPSRERRNGKMTIAKRVPVLLGAGLLVVAAATAAVAARTATAAPAPVEPAAAGLPLASVPAPAPAAVAPAATFNVKDYGAKGDGSANDASAINK